MKVLVEIEALEKVKGKVTIISCTLTHATIEPENPYQYILDCVDSGLEVEIA
jgi:hypothetical protein